MNNLLERLHASFFFYIMTDSRQFLKIGLFLPSAILISVAMMFHGLSTWVDAARIYENASEPTEKQDSPLSTPPSIKWRYRKRPVITALGIMIYTHFLGLLLFWTVTRPWFMENHQVGLFFVYSFSHRLNYRFRLCHPFYSSFSAQFPAFSSLFRLQPPLILLRFPRS